MTPSEPTDPTPCRYEFRIGGWLDDRWRCWFEGLTVLREDDRTTILRGEVVDQAALYGILALLRDIGVPLVSMRRVGEAEDPTGPVDPSPREPLRPPNVGPP